MILVAPNIANSEVRVLQHAYCDCTGIIEIIVTGCWPPYIGLDNRLTMNAIDHFSPEPSNIIQSFPATHRVRITDAKGCIRTERAINVACETTGGIIGIFSNPTYGDISIEIDVNLPLPNVKTKIFNLSMSQVHQKDYGLLAEGTHIVQDNISHLSPGMYYIGAYFDNEPVGNIFLILLSQ